MKVNFLCFLNRSTPLSKQAPRLENKEWQLGKVLSLHHRRKWFDARYSAVFGRTVSDKRFALLYNP